MSIRSLAIGSQTVASMLGAVWERLWDAETLRDGSRSTGAAYLFGYVAEMVLKQRLAMHFGLGQETPWQATSGASSMKAAFVAEIDRLRAAGHTLDYPLESHHGLLLYGMLSVKTLGIGWSAEKKRAYCRRIWEASDNWSVGLRYWPGTAPERDLERLAAAVWWLVLEA